MSQVTSIELSDELTSHLDRLAEALDRPRTWLIEQAIVRFVEQQAEEMAAINEALSAYRAGTASLRPHDDVMRRLGSKLPPTADDAHRLD